MQRGLAGFCFSFGCALAGSASAQETVIELEGEVDARAPDHVRLPFDVPAGTAEIEVRHDDLSDDNILDWGLEDPDGFRGWGGGNSEPAIVAELAASRSYRVGPIQPGEWNVIIGKAKIEVAPAPYAIEVVLRETQTLPPQPERTPYRPSAPLEEAERWYAGDFHVHSLESGDAEASLDEILDYAAGVGLDFVVIAEHNTDSHLDFFVDAQSQHPDVLLVPGVEWTSYDGHGGGIGATEWVDHKVGLDGVTAAGAIDAYHEQGALFSIHHPAFDIGNLCIGCAWTHDVEATAIDGVEIGTGSSHTVFFDDTMAFWDGLLDAGGRPAALGGSDDHRAGQDVGPFGAPIGSPTTMVYATELSADAILEGVRRGRTVVRLTGAEAPMVELDAEGLDGVDVEGAEVILRATVTGGDATDLRFVQDGVAGDPVAVTSDPFEAEVVVTAGPDASIRVRAEALVGTAPVTVTSHVFVHGVEGGLPAPTPEPGAMGAEGGGCGCTTGPRAPIGWGAGLGVGLLALVRRAMARRGAQKSRATLGDLR